MAAPAAQMAAIMAVNWKEQKKLRQVAHRSYYIYVSISLSS
jgi:hypothetical protein